jgi:hypothetical protein
VSDCGNSNFVNLEIMETRRITLSLPADLVKQAKVYAAERDTTINTLIRELLNETVTRHDRVRAAGERLLALADRGPYSSVDPGSISREEMHERR